MDIFTKVAESFESQAFMKTIGAKLDFVEEGAVIISLELKPGMKQQHGFGHAGITFSIGDSAAGLCGAYNNEAKSRGFDI